MVLLLLLIIPFSFKGKERSSSEELRKHAELNPEAREVLLEKASAKERNFKRIANREEFLKMLEQVDGVLNAVEHELSKHGPGTIKSANQSVNALFANTCIKWINLIVSICGEVLLTVLASNGKVCRCGWSKFNYK